MSAPDASARSPAPLSTATLMSGFEAMVSAASRISAHMLRLMALWRSGWSRVMVAFGPSMLSRTVPAMAAERTSEVGRDGHRGVLAN